MNTTPYLQRVAEAEPWRLGLGQPRNALDPTWVPSLSDNYCDREIEWEGATGWWVCQQCGYIGSSCFTRHRPVYSPLGLFLRGLDFFLSKRVAHTPDPRLLLQQILFVTGVALRHSALPPLREIATKVARE